MISSLGTERDKDANERCKPHTCLFPSNVLISTVYINFNEKVFEVYLIPPQFHIRKQRNLSKNDVNR